jgi:hypothetical protein
MSKNRDKNQHNQHPTGNDRKPAYHDQIKWPSIYPVRIELDAEDKQRYAEEQKYQRSQLSIGKWLNRITAIGTLVGLTGLIYLYGTLKTTQRQVSDSESVQAAQLIVNISPVQSLGVLGASATENEIVVNWNIEAKNVGPTIARNVGLFSEYFEIVGANGGYVEPPGHPFAKLVPRPSLIGPAIPPNGESINFPLTRQMPITSSKSSVVIFTQISYIDIFKHAQIAPVCLYYNWQKNGFTYCPQQTTQQGNPN